AASDVALICVGTPDLGHGEQDLTALSHVADSIGQACAGRSTPLTIVLRSTVMPGTTARMLARILTGAGESCSASIHMAMNPEFMREGSSLEDFKHPPFVLVGCDDPDTAQVLRELYSGVEAPFIETSIRTAEMVKYACNAFHAL